MQPTNRTSDHPRRGWLRSALLVALTALVVAPLTAYAGDSFSDVPDSNIFHDDIDWMADNGVTAGCGGDRFCPDDTVTREQMSAFMRRLDSQDVFTTPDEVAASIGAANYTTPAEADAAAATSAAAAVDANNDAYDAFIPIATVQVINGARRTTSFRSPVTSRPSVRVVTATNYEVTVPGVTLLYDTHIATCSALGNNDTVVSYFFNAGLMRVLTFDAGDTFSTDTDDFVCTIYKS